MAEQVEYVGGEGWISDESEFYGDQEEQLRYEKEVRGLPKRRYQSPVKLPAVKKIRTAPTPPPSSVAKEKIHSDEHVLDFLKPWPQLRKLDEAHAKDLQPSINEKARTVSGKEVEDLVEVGTADGDLASWQYGKETIDEFLFRAPAGNASEVLYGPWLWVQCPKISKSHAQSRKSKDATKWQDAVELLHKFDTQKAIIEQQNSGKEQSTITRKLAPYRDELEKNILTLAVESGVVVGKWMLFPNQADLPRYWRLVATATSEGKLGMTAKVSTEVGVDATLICIYTHDFSDTEDVVRVLKELVELGLCSTTVKPIYYKCDAYTHLGIQSNNAYKLRASLYSSKDLLTNEAKALTDGPVARLKQRNKKMEDYFRAFSGDMDDID